ncbi:phosphatidate cytidylyltransferase [Arthrobacter silviterrae]|uniref:phosphatidate cytidylyltransferase n=1 Tax=Arthrobacter silviterrae TaxID=2026658 RepID=UPI00196AC8FC|nr:phosphatidate cytidylyltransferase [Arthrobacter silviterrae]
MNDPQPAPAGSPGEGPDAPSPAADAAAEPAAYQFPTRKARRVAELTGLIPVVVPENTPAAKLSGPPTTAGAVVPESAAPAPGAPAANAPGVPAPAAKPVPAPAAPVPAQQAHESKAKAPKPKSSKPKAPARQRPAVPVPAAPVPAVPVPAVPLPVGPVAAIPDEVSAGKPQRTPKAGRDLPAAVGVGVTLLVLVLGSLLFFPVAFVIVATAFSTVGVWEVSRAIARRGIKTPLTPVMIGALAMPASAYFAGSEGLLFALVATAGATLLWRSLDSEPGAVKSIVAGVFSLLWIPFLLSFVFLMLRGTTGPTLGLTPDLGNINPGVVEVVIMLILVVANDTFGYLVGVLFGKHPMAPQISPKKSWEGFAGSMGGATLVAIPATVFLLDQHWWVGLALAIGMVLAGTGGDFAESMVKRELGVKDMSNLLPGHGGVMDRLDSILFAAPVAYAIFSILGQL